MAKSASVNPLIGGEVEGWVTLVDCVSAITSRNFGGQTARAGGRLSAALAVGASGRRDTGRRFVCGQANGSAWAGESRRRVGRASRLGWFAEENRSQLGLRLVSVWKNRPAAARAAAGRGRVGFSSWLGLWRVASQRVMSNPRIKSTCCSDTMWNPNWVRVRRDGGREDNDINVPVYMEGYMYPIEEKDKWG